MGPLAARAARFFQSDVVAACLVQAYSEPHRAYHNMTHLQAMFDTLAPHLAGDLHSVAIETAVWFHDVVYQVDSDLYRDNETRSVQEMVSLLADHAPAWMAEHGTDELALAGEMIFATRRHNLDAFTSRVGKRESSALFLDADLSILGSNIEAFVAYDCAIAKEWGQDPVRPSQQFCAGRFDAMSKFLDRKTIFYSPHFAHLEPVARTNIGTLLKRYKLLRDRASPQ